ncbi:MAG: right-handed parallel beta-helix repeat-containing protein, partial [Candidatus Marinimicrobia bacterium]|nr:right-handed parallel beta-helix repeat-containing protein [Candidatus Neomarinimicrobiota bacterium]
MRTMLLSLSLVLLFFSISVNAQILVDTVADTTDSGDGVTTLREAVEAANITVGVQTITFDPLVFPIDSGTVIYLDSALILTDEAGVIITGDGVEVILDGGEPAPGDTTLPDTIFYSGLVLESGNNEISGLKFQNFGVAGIEVDSSLTGGNYGNNSFTGNEIWFSGTGILANTSDNNAFSYNNVHDNYNSGIEVDFSANNQFHGNLLAFNGFDGLTIYKGAGGNIITENVVIGNDNDGLSIYGGLNRNNAILRNNIGDTSFVPPIPIGSELGDRSQVSGRVDRKILLKLQDIQQKAKIRSIESRETRGERKSVLKKAAKSAVSTNRKSADQRDAVADRERKERVEPVRSKIPAEGGTASPVSHTGNGNAGIYLYGVSEIVIEDNLIFGGGYYGLYIEGFFQVDSIFAADTTLDTTYYFPYDVYVTDNRFVRNMYADIEFCYIEGMTVAGNSFRHSYEAIYGYGSYSLYDDSPEIRGGIVNVINNDFTSGSNAYFFDAYYLYKVNMVGNVISSIYVATELYRI